MRNVKNYGTILKKLLCFTDIKFVVFSKALGYDISYISKWCHNTKIPTPKNIEIINDKASRIFSDEIVEQNKTREFCDLFKVTELIDLGKRNLNDELKKYINDLLDVAYKKSESSMSHKNDIKKQESTVITGKNQVSNFIRNLIAETIENSDTDIDFLCTMDICKLSTNLDLENISEYKTKDIMINAKIGFDMEEFETSPNFYLWRIYFILNKKWNVEFEFFDNKDINKLNIISIRNEFAIICSLDSDGIIEIATVIKDKETVNAIYDKNILKFKTKDILVKAAEISELTRGRYRTDFYSNDEFQFVSTKGFEFLLPADIISDVIKVAYKQGIGDDISFVIKKLQITWEERFEKSKINFIILKSALMKYIEDGEIFYTNIRCNLSMNQRKEHVSKIIETMKKNSDIKIIILDDELLSYNLDFSKISVNVNTKKVFLKKNLQNNPNNKSTLYTIINDKLVKYINKCLLSVIDKEVCKEYDAEAVECAIEKYGNMFLRMIEAKNDEK